MITTTLKPELLLTSDLRNIVRPGTLLQFTLNATANVNFNSGGPSETHPFSPRMMLTLLSYCYASGIYASWDIERAIHMDGTVRYICARQYPGWLDIRRFRRQHRELVAESLAITLKQVWIEQMNAQGPEVCRDGALECDIDQEIQALARNRVETAIIMDRAETDL
jgi:hypothetical protein